MKWRKRWEAIQKVPAVRTALFLVGLLLIAAAPAVGALPGPGGVILFAAGFALTLKYSEWAKRKYARFKRHHPNKGHWVDWSLRRKSALRRERVRKAEKAAGPAGSD
jgi:hypothetical protein